jgi:hypothetical protein
MLHMEVDSVFLLNGIPADTTPCLLLTTTPSSLKTRQRRMPFRSLKTETSCLDDLSIKGDIPEDVSDMEYKIDS